VYKIQSVEKTYLSVSKAKGHKDRNREGEKDEAGWEKPAQKAAGEKVIGCRSGRGKRREGDNGNKNNGKKREEHLEKKAEKKGTTKGFVPVGDLDILN